MKFTPIFVKGLVAAIVTAGLSVFGQGTVRRVDTLAELLSVNPTTVAVAGKLSYEVGGYYTNGDWGAPRIADWVSAGGLTTNRVYVFDADSGQWRFRDYKNGTIDVRYAGAQPDDGVDDYAAVSAVVTLLTNGNTMFFPAGVWTVTAPVTIPAAAKLHIKGSGASSTFLSRSGGNTNFIFIIGDGTNTFSGLKISDLTLDGTDTAAGGIRAFLGSSVDIDRVNFQEFTAYGADLSSTAFFVSGCTFTDFASTNTLALRFSVGGVHVVEACRFSTAGRGIDPGTGTIDVIGSSFDGMLTSVETTGGQFVAARKRTGNAVDAAPDTAETSAALHLLGTDALAADKGYAIGLGGVYDGSGNQALLGLATSRRVNATPGNYASYWDFYTRKTDNNWVKGLRIDENGDTIFQQGAKLGSVLHDYWTPYMLNVRDSGATPDDGTDDATAIQAAITEAEASATFGTVYIPPGVYRINSTIRISKAVRLTGSTFRETSLSWYPTTSTNFMLQIQPTSGSIIGAAVENLTFTMYGNGNGIGMTNAGRSLIQNCRFYEFNNYGIRTYGSPDSRILRNVFTGNNTNIDCVAIALGASSGQSVQHNTINYSGIGILYEESQTVDVNHNTFEYNFIGIDRPNGNHQSGGQIGNNFFEFNEYAHLRLGVGKYAGSFHTTLTNSQQFGSLKISGNTLSVGSAASTNTIVIVDEHDNVSFIGNEIYGKIRITTNANNLTFIGNGYNTFLGGVGSGSGEIIFDGDRTGIFADGEVSRNDAAFEVASTTKPMVPPRMSTAAMLALTNAIPASFAWNTNDWQMKVYDGTNWVALGSGGTGSCNCTNGYVYKDATYVIVTNTTAESTLYSWTIPADTLSEDGDEIEFYVSGKYLEYTGQTNGYSWSFFADAGTAGEETIGGIYPAALASVSTSFATDWRVRMRRLTSTNALLIASHQVGGDNNGDMTNAVTTVRYLLHDIDSSWTTNMNFALTVTPGVANSSHGFETYGSTVIKVSGVAVSGGSGTAVTVDSGSAMAAADFIDNSEIGFTQAGSDVTATIIDGSISTNKISSAFYSWLGTLGGSSYTFTNGVTNASGTVSAALAAGSNISITNNNGLLTISAVTSTNSGTVVSVDGGSAMATANFIDNTAIGFVQTGNDVTATIVDSSISTNKIDSTFYDLLTDTAGTYVRTTGDTMTGELFAPTFTAEESPGSTNAGSMYWSGTTLNIAAANAGILLNSTTSYNPDTYSSGGYDLIVRNAGNAKLEKIASSTFQTANSVLTAYTTAKRPVAFWEATSFKPITNSTAAAIPAVRGNGFHNYTFSGTVNQTVVMYGIVPSEGNVDTTGGFTVHITTTATSTSNAAVFEASVMAHNTSTDVDSDSYDTAATVTINAPGTSGFTTVSTISLSNIDSLTYGVPFTLKLQRLTDNGSDTDTGTWQVYAVRITED